MPRTLFDFPSLLGWAQATGEAATPFQVAKSLILTTGGGILTGLACGGAAIVVGGRTSDHLVETTLTVVAAYGSSCWWSILACLEYWRLFQPGS
jgi:monovalent cation:H+ antiporter, CPA1 family